MDNSVVIKSDIYQTMNAKELGPDENAFAFRTIKGDSLGRRL